MEYLLKDICRCHDDTCPKHKTCLRWLDRNPKDWIGVVYTKTLRDVNSNKACEYYMEATK